VIGWAVSMQEIRGEHVERLDARRNLLLRASAKAWATSSGSTWARYGRPLPRRARRRLRDSQQGTGSARRTHVATGGGSDDELVGPPPGKQGNQALLPAIAAERLFLRPPAPRRRGPKGWSTSKRRPARSAITGVINSLAGHLLALLFAEGEAAFLELENAHIGGQFRPPGCRSCPPCAAGQRRCWWRWRTMSRQGHAEASSSVIA